MVDLRCHLQLRTTEQKDNDDSGYEDNLREDDDLDGSARADLQSGHQETSDETADSARQGSHQPLK